MRRFFLPLLAFGFLVLSAVGCDLVGSSEEDTNGTFILQGQVLDTQTDAPIPSAEVRAAPPGHAPLATAETDSLGQYDFAVEIDSTMELEVTASKNGVTSNLHTVLAQAGETKELPALSINLGSDGGGQTETGPPSSINLVSQSQQSIMVKESGGVETASLAFQVTDVQGRPVPAQQSGEVRFYLSGASPADASIAPETTQPDANGQVEATLTSGTTAGVVQVVAETEDAEGTAVRSKPVSLAIHGGFPVVENFHVRSEQTNLASRDENPDVTISVEVGDQYNNPVKPGTAVYFTTTRGLVEGSVQTDERGRGSVQFSRVGVAPNEVVRVTATTADENEQSLQAETGLFLSGDTEITVDPTTATLGETYTLTVSDSEGFPLAPGTNIRVEAEGTKVKAVGHTDVTLDDYGFVGDYTAPNIRRGEGITEFTFRAVEDQEVDESGTPTLETIKITVSSPNGDLEVVMTGSGTSSSVQALTKDATVDLQPDGSAVVRR